jgi:hypothetical protein
MENIEQMFRRLHIHTHGSTNTQLITNIHKPPQPSMEKFVRAAVTEINTLRHQNKQLQGQIEQLKKLILEKQNPVSTEIPFWVR